MYWVVWAGVFGVDDVCAHSWIHHFSYSAKIAQIKQTSGQAQARLCLCYVFVQLHYTYARHHVIVMPAWHFNVVFGLVTLSTLTQ